MLHTNDYKLLLKGYSDSGVGNVNGAERQLEKEEPVWDPLRVRE